MAPVEAPASCRNARLQSPVVGWLLPAARKLTTAELRTFELHQGTHYVGLNSQGLVRYEGAHEGAVSVSVQRAECVIAGQKYYHGDTLPIDGEEFRIALLATRAYVNWFSMIPFFLFTLSCSLSSWAVQAAGQDAPVVLSPTGAESPRALYRGSLELQYLIPGARRLSVFENTKALVRTGSSEHVLPLRSIHQPKTHYTFVVDISSLCLRREREDDLNQELRRFVDGLPTSSWVSVYTYFQGSGAAPVAWEKVIANESVQTIQASTSKRSEYIQCRPRVESANVYDAILALKHEFQQTDAFIQTDSKTEWWRRVLIIFTPGNARLNAQAEQLIHDFDFDVYPVVYSGVRSPFTDHVLQELAQVHEGKVFWWDKGTPLGLIETFPFLWSMSLDFNVPYGLEEKSYPLEIQIQGHKLRADVQYFRDPRAYFLYRAGRVLLWLLVLAATFYAIQKTVRYYKTPRCPRTKKVTSHTWNRSLFGALGRSPVLLVTSPHGYERAHVLDEKRVRVGRQWNCALRLYSPFSTDRTPFLIERVGYESFAMRRGGRKGPEAFALSGVIRKSEVFLKHGDEFCFGEYTIQFLNPPDAAPTGGSPA